MHRTDTPGSSPSGEFLAGNPIAGVDSTIMGADWPNAVQEEIAEVIEAEGFGLVKTNNAQLRIAIQSMIDQGSSPVGWLNARTDFLAVGDGAIDDTAAIQAGIDSATVSGGTLYLPRGTYRTTAALILKAGVTLIGDGRLSILDLNHDGNGLDCESGQGMRVTNLAFGGRAAVTPVTERAALRVLAGANQIQLDHLYFDDVVNCAITIAGSAATVEILLESILIDGTGEHGILILGDARRIQLSNIIGRNIGAVTGGIGSAVGLKIDEAQDVQAVNVWMDAPSPNGAGGIVVGPDLIANACSRISLFGCHGQVSSAVGSNPGLHIQNDASEIQVHGGTYVGDVGVRLSGSSGSDRPLGVQLNGVRGESTSTTGIYGLRINRGEEIYVQGGLWLPGLATGHAIRVTANAVHVFLDGLFTGRTADASRGFDILNSTTYVDRIHQRGTGVLGVGPSSTGLRVLPSTPRETIAPLPVNDTTPSVLGQVKFLTANTSATLITQFDDGEIGQEILVLVDDANTTLDFTSSNLRGNGGVDWAVPIGESFRAVFDGTDWYVDKRA